MRTLLTLILIGFCLNLFATNNYTYTRKISSPPRGGGATGIPTKADLSTPSSWLSLQEAGISSYERDRRAILALAGSYDIKFEFLETYLIDSQTKIDLPYISKATEFVTVIEDSGDFISLQHILVMFFKQGGQVHGPIITKHWRQDWQWEATQRSIFQGSNTWKSVLMSKDQSKNKWTWSVFQVDDSPRYSGLGKWAHTSSASFFDSERLSRPLPRREFSVRNDYKLLMGNESLVVTKLKWFHEQKAFKHQSNLVDGEFSGKLLAREVGQNSYHRIKDFDWSSGKEYWDKTKPYWREVRYVWKNLLKRDLLTLKKKVRGRSLYSRQFENAQNPSILALPHKKMRKLIENTILEYIK